MHCEARSGDSSAVAVASTLASLSNLRKELSVLPPSGNDDDVQQGSETPKLPSASGVSNNDVDDTEMKDSPDDNDRPGTGEKTSVPSPNACNDNLNIDPVRVEPVDPEVGKLEASAHEIRPLLKALAGSAASEFDFSGSISKILDDQREIRELLKDFDTPVLTSTRRQAFKDVLHQGLLDPGNIDVSFENFPYYLR